MSQSWQPESSFYVHEDDFGMIDFLPAENLSQIVTAFAELEVHSAGTYVEGGGWTGVYIQPTPKYPLAARRIEAAALRSAFSSALPNDRALRTDYPAEPMRRNKAFALGRDDSPMIFGFLDDGLVVHCHCTDEVDGLEEQPTSVRNAIAAALVGFGALHKLILVDWRQSIVVNLSDDDAVTRYLAAGPKY